MKRNIKEPPTKTYSSDEHTEAKHTEVPDPQTKNKNKKR